MARSDSEAGAGRAGFLLGGTLAILGIGLLGVAYHFANQLTKVPEVRPFEVENEVLAVTGTSITLRDEGNAGIDGRWGLQLPGDRHARLGSITDRSDGQVTWTLAETSDPPPVVGEVVRIDEFVWVGTPSAVGLPFSDTEVPGPLGPLPTWLVPADGEPVGTVVFVHGRGATREASLRFLPALTGAGWDVVVPTYRGGSEGPAPTDGRIHYGTTEWADLEAVVRDVYTDAPDRPIVLYGASMGGSIVLQFRDRSQLGDEVSALVLDSPMLSMQALLELQAGRNGIPGWVEPALLPLVTVMADNAFGLDSASLEQVADDRTVALPTLILHGTDDTFVPATPSAELAAISRHVTLSRFERADHDRGWNVDSERYEQELTDFLRAVIDGSA